MPPVVTFTTDFGTRDPFVAAMKGVVLSICPEAALVDVTHEVEPQDVLGGALALWQAARFFPPGTVHVAVVDPGVGGARAAIALRAAGQAFVGPDNGILTLGARDPEECRRIENPAWIAPSPSATFHGRDLFAPAAARLARGEPIADAGPAHEPARLAWPEPPQVIGADRFGNLITSLRAVELPSGTRAIEVEHLGTAPLRRTYADVARGEAVAYAGSAGLIEIAVREGSAAGRLRAAGSALRGLRVVAR